LTRLEECRTSFSAIFESGGHWRGRGRDRRECKMIKRKGRSCLGTISRKGWREGAGFGCCSFKTLQMNIRTKSGGENVTCGVVLPAFQVVTSILIAEYRVVASSS
jgi:hypothetical protein